MEVSWWCVASFRWHVQVWLLCPCLCGCACLWQWMQMHHQEMEVNDRWGLPYRDDVCWDSYMGTKIKKKRKERRTGEKRKATYVLETNNNKKKRCIWHVLNITADGTHTHTTTNIASHKHVSIMRFFERTKDIHQSLFLGRGKSMSYAQCQPWICHERRSTEKQYNCENIFALLLSPTYEHFTQNTSVCWCIRDKLSNKSHQTGNCFSYETMSEACLQPACMVLCVQISVPYNIYIYIVSLYTAKTASCEKI